MKNQSKYIGLLLDSNGFIVLNKVLIKKIGLDATVMIGELISEYNYYDKMNRLTNKEWFYSTQANITENAGLTRHEQEASIKKLIEMKILETKMMGMPQMKYFRISFKELENIIKKSEKSPKIKDVKNDKQGCKNLQARMSKVTSKDVKSDKQGCKNLQARMSKVTSKDVKNDKQGCKNLQPCMSKMTTNNNNNSNNKTVINNNLILSTKDEMRRDEKYQTFLKKIEIDKIIENHKELIGETKIEDICKVVADIYNLNENEYITIRGHKVYAKEIVNILDEYDSKTMEYVLYGLENSDSKIKNIKAYIIATLYNAPKTINIYEQNNKVVKPIEREVDYDEMFREDAVSI